MRAFLAWLQGTCTGGGRIGVQGGHEGTALSVGKLGTRTPLSSRQPGPGRYPLGLGGLLLRAMVGRSAFPGNLPWAVSPQPPLSCPVYPSSETETQVRAGTEAGQLPTSRKDN